MQIFGTWQNIILFGKGGGRTKNEMMVDEIGLKQ